jgi:amino acid adenylation domain-containing protein
MTNLADQLADLSLDKKRSTLLRLLKERSEDSTSNLSLEQRRLWFLRQLDPTVPVHVFAAFGLVGVLDVAGLQQGLVEVGRRQEVLRSSFVELEGRPLRVVAAGLRLPLPVVDLTGLPGRLVESELRRLAGREARQGFDLVLGPLLRAQLVRLAAERHVLFVTAHRLVCDERSLELLRDELVELYRALAAGREPPPAPERQFADAVALERAQLADPVELERRLAYWRERLAGLEPLELVTDRPRPALKTVRAGRACATLDHAQTAALARLGDGDPVAALSACFALLLARAANQPELALGLARPRPPQLERLIGPLTNQLVLRLEPGRCPTMHALVAQLKERTREAEANELPLEALLEALQPERDLSHTPLFQVALEPAHPTPEAIPVTPELTLQPRELGLGSTIYDLTLRTRPSRDSLQLELEYNSDLYHPDTAKRLLAQLHTLADNATQQPDQRPTTLPLTDRAEQQLLTLDWNQTSRPYPTHTLLHQLVEQQAKRTPDQPAATCNGHTLTYHELDQQANQLAHQLQANGARPDTIVAILAERSLPVLTALLATLKAGAAYLPLDPTHPRHRLQHMLTDSTTPLILTPHHLQGLIPPTPHPTTTLTLNHQPTQPTSPPTTTTHPDNLAYTIYTSGSTGTPKAVLVPHTQIVHATTARQAYDRHPPDDYLLLAPLTFDASAHGIYWTLTNGGRLVIPTDDEVEDPRALLRLIEREGVQHVDCTPSVYELLLERGWNLRSVREVTLGGEPCTQRLVLKHWHNLPRVPLYNEYGPTEATVWSTVHKVTPADHTTPTIPIGRPIPNTRTYILDDHQQPLPIGIPGELCIGGAGITRGYHNQPALTAHHYRPDPCTTTPGARLYRTGDRARWQPSGELEYLGRHDTQIKLHGYRIELGEIETTLDHHPQISKSAVLAREDSPGDKRLTAYIVPQGDATNLEAELVAALERRLPDYMIPQQIVFVDDLPRSPNGKLDRRALLAVAGEHRTPAPAGPVTDDLERDVADLPEEAVDGLLLRLAEPPRKDEVQ